MQLILVIPAKAGIQLTGRPLWIPAFAGMTVRDLPQKINLKILANV